MPTIITGEAGNNGVADFVAALRAGRGDKLDARRAESLEKGYAQRLELGVQQIKLNDARLDALGDEERARETYGELEGIWAQAQASGDPANVAGFQVMFNTQPEAVKLWGRLAADSPELANVFRDNILKDAQANMEREQMQSFFEKAQAAEGVFLPEGWVQQSIQDIQAGATTPVETTREYARMRKGYGDQASQAQENQEQLAKLDVLIEAVQDTLKPEQKSDLRSLRAQIEAEAEVSKHAGTLDENLYGKAMALITGHQAGDGQFGQESAPIVGEAGPEAGEPEQPRTSDDVAPRPRDPEIDRALLDQGGERWQAVLEVFAAKLDQTQKPGKMLTEEEFYKLTEGMTPEQMQAAALLAAQKSAAPTGPPGPTPMDEFYGDGPRPFELMQGEGKGTAKFK